MRTANEVVMMYALYRTYVMAGTASGTLGVVDYCKIVFNLDCALGTGFLALAAGYTTVLANLTHLRALVMTATFNYNL